MTPAELHRYCAGVQLAAPVTLDDAREVLEDLRPRMAEGIPFEVTIDRKTGRDLIVVVGIRSARIVERITAR